MGDVTILGNGTTGREESPGRDGYGVPVFTQNSTGIAPDTTKVL
jgi:hypothetical protein